MSHLNLSETKALAERLIEEYLPGRGWTMRFDNAKNRLGACFHSRRTIQVSRHYAALNGAAAMENTIRHEIAHAIAGRAAGHGPDWRLACRITGARPERCNDNEKTGIVAPPSAWLLVCPKCGTSTPRHRKTTTIYQCRKCRVPVEWRRGGTGIAMRQPEPVAASVPTPAERVAEVAARVSVRWGA